MGMVPEPQRNSTALGGERCRIAGCSDRVIHQNSDQRPPQRALLRLGRIPQLDSLPWVVGLLSIVHWVYLQTTFLLQKIAIAVQGLGPFIAGLVRRLLQRPQGTVVHILRVMRRFAASRNV